MVIVYGRTFSEIARQVDNIIIFKYRASFRVRSKDVLGPGGTLLLLDGKEQKTVCFDGEGAVPPFLVDYFCRFSFSGRAETLYKKLTERLPSSRNSAIPMCKFPIVWPYFTHSYSLSIGSLFVYSNI